MALLGINNLICSQMTSSDSRHHSVIDCRPDSRMSESIAIMSTKMHFHKSRTPIQMMHPSPADRIRPDSRFAKSVIIFSMQIHSHKSRTPRKMIKNFFRR